MKPADLLSGELSLTGEFPVPGGIGEHPSDSRVPLPSGVRVLIADDDARVRRSIASTLNRLGFDVKVADDGGPAIQMAEQQHMDLVLVDYYMPTSGLDVTRAIKARYGASTHVCILSGDDTEDLRLAAFDAGADDFLVKPISMTELRRRMAAAARKHNAYIEARLAREEADRLLAWGTEASALLAHDLNNGLAVALSNITYLAQVLELAPDDLQALQSTQRALRRMSGLVANFVDIARFEDHALKARPSRVVVRELLLEVMNVHAPSLRPEIRYTVACDPQLEGFFDEALIARVLHNLVGNASRYCNAGGCIRISARPYAGPSPLTGVELIVQNTGPAIPAELADKLFSKYALGRGGQRGLGLYFCKLACEAHGGTAQHLAEGDGPSFVLRLPNPDRDSQ